MSASWSAIKITGVEIDASCRAISWVEDFEVGSAKAGRVVVVR